MRIDNDDLDDMWCASCWEKVSAESDKRMAEAESIHLVSEEIKEVANRISRVEVACINIDGAVDRWTNTVLFIFFILPIFVLLAFVFMNSTWNI